MEKQCSKCGEIKDVSEFYKKKKNKDGYSHQCKICCKQYYAQNIDKIKESNKEWRNKNADKIKKRTEEWREQNLEKIKEQGKKYYKQNHDKIKEQHTKYLKQNSDNIKEQQKEYYKQNSDKIKKRTEKWRKDNLQKIKEYQKKYYKQNYDKKKEYRKQYYKENLQKFKKQQKEYSKNNRAIINKRIKQYYNNDEIYRIKEIIRRNFARSIKNQFIKKTMSTCNYTGINYSVYVEHFKNDPLWNDYCNNENIHIDHIIPVSAYDFNDKNEIKKCWHYRNLRLLNGIENMSKNNKIDYDLIKQYGIEDLLPDSLLKAGIE